MVRLAIQGGELLVTHDLLLPCTLVRGRHGRVGDLGQERFGLADLVAGHKYEFRVAAVNSEGQSEWLTSDGAILAKDPWG